MEKQFFVSYISNSGVIVLNQEMFAKDSNQAINDIKNDTGVYCILSCISANIVTE